MLSLVLVFSAYALVDGIFAIVAAVRAMRQHERWGYLLLEGIVSITAAAIAFLWLARENSSACSRVIPYLRAKFSAVSPILR